MPHYPSWGLETRSRMPAGIHRIYPHYPSWGLETPHSLQVHSSRRISLPLMGIGNWTNPAISGHWITCSLPLMGIGNGKLQRQVLQSIADSLPLMGIGNVEDDLTENQSALDSLPLMGIGNVEDDLTENQSALDSLPLMGIGNGRVVDDLQRGTDLITSHGDWKRSTTRARTLSTHSHYPSWGLETMMRYSAMHLSWCSLPLMGIGNSTKRFRVASLNVLSLPLMGIGNVDVEDAGSQQPKLITPHGDWKRFEVTYSQIHCPGSLPLMGIGNQSGRSTLSEEAASHYPSWGLETTRARRSAGNCWNSLPLMGTGNTRCGGCGQPATKTHYPSWGLETWTARADPDPRVASLPLMGIGNGLVFLGVLHKTPLITPHGDWKPSRRRGPRTTRTSHYPSWGLETPHAPGSPSRSRHLITPHGDWKLLSSGVVSDPYINLITPHGDWKLPPALPHHIDARGSLPLMGIGNQQQTVPQMPHNGASLPLMGIGNYHRHSRTTLTQEAHYPSWGLETRSPPGVACAAVFSLPLMGIGNGHTVVVGMRPFSLITPHAEPVNVSETPGVIIY